MIGTIGKFSAFQPQEPGFDSQLCRGSVAQWSELGI